MTHQAPMWRQLVETCKKVLIDDGYEMVGVPGLARKNVWSLRKDGHQTISSLRTTQDRWFAYNFLEDGWQTLDEVETVVLAALDNPDDPRNIEVYMFPAEEVRERFNAAAQARIDAGHKVRKNFGMWISLDRDDRGLAISVGSGLSERYSPIAVVPLVPGNSERSALETGESRRKNVADVPSPASRSETIPVVVADAKRRIAAIAGVPETCVRLDLHIDV